MDYLKSFTIGTSGPVFFPHIALLSLKDENFYDYSFKTYSLLGPIYYGLMNMLSVYLGKIFHLSLQLRLFFISILSILFIVSLNFFVSRKKYKPYKNYTSKEWLSYILLNGSRHLIAFNLVIFNFTKYFSTSWPLRVFIIGSSFFSYFITYLKVLWLDYKKKLNYDYRTFAVGEPFIQGSDLLISLFILQKIFGLGLKLSLLIWNFSSSFIWLFIAHTMKTYTHKNQYEWLIAFTRVLLTGFIKIVPIYYLLTNLK